MPIQAGSCRLDELVLVGYGKPAGNDVAAYNSFMAVGSIAEDSTGIPVDAIINGAYKAAGINPVGERPVYACPRDWETIIVDRRTGWDLEKRLGLIAAALLVAIVVLKFAK